MTLLQIVEWELYLWRPAATDSRLPWQKPLAVDQLTPGRVIRSFGENLERVGTPVSPVLPRGKSQAGQRDGTGQVSDLSSGIEKAEKGDGNVKERMNR